MDLSRFFAISPCEVRLLLPRSSTVLCLIVYLAAVDSAAGWTITPRSTMAIDTTAVPGLMELSGAAYRGPLGGSTHELYAIQDSGNQLVTLSFGITANGSLTSAATTATRTLAPGFDLEGVALGPAGSVLAAEESTPAIRRYDVANGAATALLSMPSVFANSRSNFAFESLTRAPGGETYWTANEAAATVDGPIANTSQGTTVRLQRFNYDGSGTLTLGPQYAYQVDPIHVGTTTDSNTRSGLVDLVALPDSSLLALERSLGNGLPPYENRIYRVTFDGATDISQAPFSTGLVGQTYSAATKTLLWKGQAGGGFGQNMEGLALGPQLPGGDWSLLGVVDNGGGGDPLSGNTLVSFSLAPSVAGDFNGDGTVDGGDYVVWRENLGSLFVASDYNTWRSHFGQSAGAGAEFNSPDSTAVPELSSNLVLLLALLALTFGRAGIYSRPLDSIA